MPIYNAEKDLSQAIRSVLSQSYKNWELLLINDGSQDKSESIAKSFNDHRIHYFTQQNRGVSAARNVGLRNLQGKYFCFLDADDVMPEKSIESRVKLLIENDSLSFVDGTTIFVDHNLKSTGKKHTPSFTGKPLSRLLRLDSSCFLGNTWMIKRKEGLDYTFNEKMTHSEDILFYLSTCNQDRGEYAYVDEPVLYYRQGEVSAMKNFNGLELGYIQLIRSVRYLNIGPNLSRAILKLKCMKIMFLSHLFDGKKPLTAFLSIFRIGLA